MLLEKMSARFDDDTIYISLSNKRCRTGLIVSKLGWIIYKVLLIHFLIFVQISVASFTYSPLKLHHFLLFVDFIAAYLYFISRSRSKYMFDHVLTSIIRTYSTAYSKQVVFLWTIFGGVTHLAQEMKFNLGLRRSSIHLMNQNLHHCHILKYLFRQQLGLAKNFGTKTTNL